MVTRERVELARYTYCPRCDAETRWFNVAFLADLNRWACAPCGLEEAELLTEAEWERWLEHLDNEPR